MTQEKSKKWFLSVLTVTIVILIGTAIATIMIDPYFHYHRKLPKPMQYRIYDQRYQNDGILKHFDYDAVVIGTSMTDNFKTSQIKAKMGYNAVKVPFSGARYKELNENTLVALSTHSNVKCVIRCLDSIHIAEDKDSVYYDVVYPTYLYDKSYFNDLHYLFNRDVFLDGTVGDIVYTISGNKTTKFDDYCSWDRGGVIYDVKKAVSDYETERPKKVNENKGITDADIKMIQDNLEQNVISTVKAYPKVKFVFYFPPYSIIWWDQENQNGYVDYDIAVQREAIKELLPYPNVYLYAFNDNFDMIEDLSKYNDKLHYGGAVSSYIIDSIADDKGRISKDNYEDYIQKISAHYDNYDYEATFGKK
jgi:hypothetical protein